jgi:hypothetical protein
MVDMCSNTEFGGIQHISNKFEDMLALPFTNKNGQFSMQEVEPAAFTNHSAKYFERLLSDAEQLPRRDQSHIIRSQFFHPRCHL